MNLIIWLIAGAVIGGLASIVIRRSALLPNIVLGMVGALVAGYLLPGVLRVSTATPGTFSIPALLLSLMGAAALIAVGHFKNRKRTVKDAVFEAQWPLVRRKIHVRWNKITEVDIEQIDGKPDRLINLLQERYGCDEEKAEDDLQSYLRAVV